MAGENYFTSEEFKSLNYRWKDPKKKKTKFFVYSTHFYWDKKISVPKYNKQLVQDPESGRNEDIDVFRMKHGFIVHHTQDEADTVYKKNLKKKDFWEHLKTIEKDNTLARDYDCFFFMFFTFINKGTVAESDISVEQECLHFFDGFIPIHQIWEKVREIEQFRGKPKVFFIQADDYILAHPPQKLKALPVSFELKKIPIDADRLIMQSSIPRKTPGRPETEASFLVEAFIQVMEENRRRPEKDKFDLLSLTTAVNQNVKGRIEELSKNMELAKTFPYPQVSSTFTKFLYM